MIEQVVKTVLRWLVIVALVGGVFWWLAPWEAA